MFFYKKNTFKNNYLIRFGRKYYNYCPIKYFNRTVLLLNIKYLYIQLL